MNYNRILAKWRLKEKHKYLIEVYKLMQEFTTQTILDGGSPEFTQKARAQLISLQNDEKSSQRLLDFLRKTK